MSTPAHEDHEAVASRKLAAAELRRARKAARDPRSRLLSDSSDEMPKGILKNSRIPTKRSVSECVDDLSQIMADLDLNIHDLPKTSGKFCSIHHFFNEEDEQEREEDEDEEEEEEDDDGSELVEEDNEDGDNDAGDNDGQRNEQEAEEGTISENKTNKARNGTQECDCNNFGDTDCNTKPKKSVRFDERVYETVFFASRLYDRRYFSKYHFSSRHHPPSNQRSSNKSQKKGNRQRSKSEGDDESCSRNITGLKSSNSCGGGCKLSKSQRAKQSKKDKKKRLNKKDETTDTSSDDQGYSSSMHSFSD